MEYKFYSNYLKNKKELPCHLSKPCKNNACCKDDDAGGYSCTCEHGFTGQNCETRKYRQKCLICLNLSLSLNDLKTLQKALPCELNPVQCLNAGTCKDDNLGGYTCTCTNGYTGQTCDTG